MFPTVSIYADKRCERTAAEELPTSIKAFHFINIHRLETETLFLGPLKLFSSSRSLGEAGAGRVMLSITGAGAPTPSTARPGRDCQGTTAREQPAQPLLFTFLHSLMPWTTQGGAVSGPGITSRAGSGTRRLWPHSQALPILPPRRRRMLTQARYKLLLLQQKTGLLPRGLIAGL